MEYYVYHDPESELTHWGIKGMKWGVRRYQNKDGSLTKAGKKRRAKLEAELEKIGGSSKKETDAAPRKKTLSEMSNKELQEHTTRMQLEKNYYDAQRQLAAANPPKVSAGQKFANKMLNEVIAPAASNAGKVYLEKMLKEKMGVKNEDPIGDLEKTWKRLDYQQKIDKIKNPDKYLSEEDKNKRQTRDFEAETRAANREGYASVTDKAKAEKAEREKANADAANEAARAANNTKSEEYYNSTYSKSSGERTDTNPNANRGMSVVDTYKNTTVTSISTDVRDSGKTRVDTLLDKNGNKMFDFYFSEDDD